MDTAASILSGCLTLYKLDIQIQLWLPLSPLLNGNQESYQECKRAILRVIKSLADP